MLPEDLIPQPTPFDTMVGGAQMASMFRIMKSMIAAQGASQALMDCVPLDVPDMKALKRAVAGLEVMLMNCRSTVAQLCASAKQMCESLAPDAGLEFEIETRALVDPEGKDPFTLTELRDMFAIPSIREAVRALSLINFTCIEDAQRNCEDYLSKQGPFLACRASRLVFLLVFTLL